MTYPATTTSAILTRRVRPALAMLAALWCSTPALAMDTNLQPTDILVNPTGISVTHGQSRFQDTRGNWHDIGPSSAALSAAPGRKLNDINMQDNALSDVRLQPIRATSRQVRPYVILTSTRTNGQTY